MNNAFFILTKASVVDHWIAGIIMFGRKDPKMHGSIKEVRFGVGGMGIVVEGVQSIGVDLK